MLISFSTTNSCASNVLLIYFSRSSISWSPLTCFNQDCVPSLSDCTHAKLLQLCPTLCDPVDCNPPGSSVHGILQARIPEQVAMPSSRGTSWPRIEPSVLMSPALVGGFFTTGTSWEALSLITQRSLWPLLSLPSWDSPLLPMLFLFPVNFHLCFSFILVDHLCPEDPWERTLGGKNFEALSHVKISLLLFLFTDTSSWHWILFLFFIGNLKALLFWLLVLPVSRVTADKDLKPR